MKCEECEADIVEIKFEWCCQGCGMVHGQIFDHDRFENNVLVRHKDNNSLGSVTWKKNGASKLRRLAVTYALSSSQKSLKKGLFFCNIVASEFRLSESAKKTISIYYNKLFKEHVFTSAMKLEERAAALGYIVLREYGYSYTLSEMEKTLEISRKRISKLARLFARKLNKSHVFANVNVESLLEKFCLQLGQNINFVKDTINLHTYVNKIKPSHPTSAYLGAIIYFVETTQPSKTITQNNISNILGINLRTVRRNYSGLLSLVGIESTYGLTIDNIIEGIR